MKKIFNKRLILKPLISLFTLFFAVAINGASAYVEEADILKDLGLFQGSDQGYELNRAPSRVEAGVMLIRLLGKEEEAIEMNYFHPFNDVPKWANAYIGYMYEKGLTKGIGNNMYGSSDLTSGTQYLTFVLRSLNYSDTEGDFIWSEALDKAVEVGLITSEDSTKYTETFLRGEMVDASYKALKTKLKGSGLTLNMKLIDEGVYSIDKAVTHGLSEAEVISKVVYSNYLNGSNTIKIDRDSLPSSMQEFQKLYVYPLEGPGDVEFFKMMLKVMNDNPDSENFYDKVEVYDEVNGSSSYNHGKVAIMLFNEFGEYIGAAVTTTIETGEVELVFKAYVGAYPDDFYSTVNEVKARANVEDLIKVGHDYQDNIYIYVNKYEAMEALSNYGGYMTLSGMEDPDYYVYMFEKQYWTFLKASAYDTQRLADDANPNEVNSFFFLDADNKIIGYGVKTINDVSIVQSAGHIRFRVMQAERPVLESNSFLIDRYIDGVYDESFDQRAFSMGSVTIYNQSNEIIGYEVSYGAYLLGENISYKVTYKGEEITGVSYIYMD